MFASAGLDAGLFIRTQHEITRSQGLILPAALVEVQDATGLDGESRIAREYPITMPPRSQGILAEPIGLEERHFAVRQPKAGHAHFEMAFMLEEVEVA